MAVSKGTRLNKIAREFNVGVSTIVEFLEKKGHKVESNPNKKVSDELYGLICSEFSKDQSVKKESDRLSQTRHQKRKKETITLDGTGEEEENTVEETPQEETPIPEKAVKPEKKRLDIPTEVPMEDRPQLKVVGHIELEKPQKATPTPEKEQPVKADDSVSKKETPVEETPVEKTPAEKKIKKKPSVEKPALEKESQPPKKEEQPSVEVKKEPLVEAVKQPEKETTSSPEAEPSAPSIKVVDKIDLASLNMRTRPKKKTKEEKQKERQVEKKQSKPGRKPSPAVTVQKAEEMVEKDQPKQVAAKEEEEIFKPTKPELAGPKVIGTIKLPEKESRRKSDHAPGDDNKRKKRRKRIRKGKEKVVIDKKPLVKNGTPAAAAKKTTSEEPRKKRRITKRIQKRKRPVGTEIKEEDVQKQIKDTLARLTSKGKSKGSKHRREKRQAISQRHQAEIEKEMEEQRVLKITEFVTVNELATMMDAAVNQIITTCMNLGLFVSINQRLDAETITLVAEEFGYQVEFVSVEVQEAIKEEEDKAEDLLPRSPIVTVMGHVDHGKTSLLDYVRRANVIAGEAGGITQHIGAYNVTLEDNRKITFLDTPGHEAFTAMRARGAKVTDIAIIIVAADDNVMPQTIEAINHASAAGVPIVFAINKIDKPGANPDRIREKLASMNYLVEEWGGKYQCQEISAKKGVNIEELLEKVLLEAEMLELKANPKKSATGSIIESSLDKGRGYVATILVSSGTLKVGDIILAGQYHGHIKAMFNERNQRIYEAGPSEPVLILGLDGAPQAGDNFNVMSTEKEAREIANKREQLAREQGLRTQKHITLDEIGRRIAIGNFQELNVIVKGDVDGSIEALSDSLIKLSTEEIQVNVIHKAVGQISESDVMLAAASNAIIVGFQVRPSMAARKVAEREEIDIRLYSIIYDAIEEIKAAMEGMLSPEIKEEVVASLEVREAFKITKVGTIAGCMVRDGKIRRNSKVRLIRDGIVIFTGELGSLKRYKDDVKEVASGYECGLNLANFNDVVEGDIIEAYEQTEVSRKL